MDNIINSILYAIKDYEYYYHKKPDVIFMNDICANEIIKYLQKIHAYKDTLCAIPVKVAIISDEEDVYFKSPKFWLGTKGQIINY